MDISDLGACLRALRRRADLSQRELAQRAGVPPSTVSRLESGDVSNPRLQTLKQIVEAADCALVITRGDHRIEIIVTCGRSGDNAVAHLVAQFWPGLSPRPGGPADAIVGGLAVDT